MKFNLPKKFTLLVKIRLCSSIEDGFLVDHLLVYIEKEISKDSTTEMIMDEFNSMKDRRWAQFEGDKIIQRFFFGFFFCTCL
jgi:hypothetical protein